jgi:phage replication initiation protein
MGETKAPDREPGSETVQLVMTDSGKVKQVTVRSRAPGQAAHVDWVNFSISADTWLMTCTDQLVVDDDFVREASRVFADIFGFGVTRHHGKRLNFYQDSWVLGEDCGFVCFGGQRNTMLVMLNGTGCLIAKSGWESRLHFFLSTIAVRPVLTRIDLAHDDFNGEYCTVDWADQQWDEGGFCCSFGNPPNVEHKGNWKRPTGQGRTLTVGRRENGKYVRDYEKGKKEGDANSPWVRCEVEFKSSDRVLPFDMLIEPGAYFVAAYPCFAIFENHKAAEKIAIRQNTAKITVERGMENTKRQSGRWIKACRGLYHDMGMTDSDLLDRLQASDDELPKRLLEVSKDLNTCPPGLHEVPRQITTIDDWFLPKNTATLSYGQARGLA